MIREFQAYAKAAFLKLGFAEAQADDQAWDLTTLIYDRPEEMKMAPFAIYHPGGHLPPMRTGALNSDRLRHDSGLTIVIDMVAFKRAFQESVATV